MSSAMKRTETAGYTNNSERKVSQELGFQQQQPYFSIKRQRKPLVDDYEIIKTKRKFSVLIQ